MVAIVVSPQTEGLIRERVSSGRYADATAVVDEAVRLLSERDMREHLRVLIAEADAALERGEVVEWTPDLFARLKQEADDARVRGIPVSQHVRP